MIWRHRVWTIVAASALSLAMFAGDALASNYPEKTIDLVVPFGTGGSADLIARLMAPSLSEELGGTVVVRNVGGAGGTIGAAEVAASPADGYTIALFTIGPVTLQPHLRQVPYDAFNFDEVCRVGNTPVVLTTSKNGPHKSLDDLLTAARAKPNSIAFGTVGAGSISHVAVVALGQTASVKFKHVPFKGAAESVTALLGGFVDMVVEQPAVVPQFDLNPVAVMADSRTLEFPNVPTMKELGHDVVMSVWAGLFVPRGTPKEVTEKLSAACEKAVNRQTFIEGMSKARQPIAFLNASDFSKFVATENDKNRKLLETAGIKK